MNIPFVGPNVPLAGDADLADGELDLVLLAGRGPRAAARLRHRARRIGLGADAKPRRQARSTDPDGAARRLAVAGRRRAGRPGRGCRYARHRHPPAAGRRTGRWRPTNRRSVMICAFSGTSLLHGPSDWGPTANQHQVLHLNDPARPARHHRSRQQRLASAPTLEVVALILVAVILAGAIMTFGAVYTNAFGAGERFASLVHRIDLIVDPPPDRPTAPTILSTPRPSRKPRPRRTRRRRRAAP